jgi:hypothetical protein
LEEFSVHYSCFLVLLLSVLVERLPICRREFSYNKILQKKSQPSVGLAPHVPFIRNKKYFLVCTRLVDTDVLVCTVQLDQLP